MNIIFYFSFNVFLLTFFHFLGLIKCALEEVKKCLKEIQGKHISHTCWFEEIHRVNYQKNYNHAEDII